jgi:hypothetical protein
MLLSRTSVRVCAAAVAAMFVALVAACGKSPTNPSSNGPRVNAPALSSPTNGVEVSSLRPELVVDNATSTATGDRTYEFQVSPSSDFSAGLMGKGGISEGSDGKTTYAIEEDLKIASSYFWRARATQGSLVGPWSTVGSFKTRTKEPPVVSVSLPKSRADADEDLVLLALVQSADTPAELLTYEWTAEQGAISGSGRQVTWRAPRGAPPGVIELKVTVTDKYVVTNPDGTSRDAENKVTATARVTYNDSFKEIRELSLDFIGDFANSNNSPEYCVRNFSNSCAGKSAEEADIRTNRATYTINSADFAVRDIIFNPDKTVADVVARCNFVSTIKASGRTETATGTCLLQAIYEGARWLLCDSRYDGTSRVTLGFWGRE